MARKSRIDSVIQKTDMPSETAIFQAGVYLRLSDEDDNDMEGNSIGNQNKIIKNFLIGHPEIEIADTYIDNGYTGMNFQRPEFQRLKEDLFSHKVNCILVKDVSRLGRHFVLTSEYVERIFPEFGIRFISVNDGFDSFDENADTSALLMPIKMVMNDSYAKDISQKIRSSIAAKMKCGEFVPASGSIPYGYLRDSDNVTYKIDTETAEVVRKIYELRASGMSFNGIAKYLNAEGVPCPGNIRFLRGMTKAATYKDAVWQRGTIRKITNDLVYIGNRIHGKEKRDKLCAPKISRAREEWQIIEDAHPAIISKGLYDAVQKINREELSKRADYGTTPEPDVDYRELFRGKIFCGDCGKRMQGQKGCARVNSKTPSRIFFDCSEYKRSNHQRCKSHYIRQETIMSAVASALEQQIKLAVDVEQFIANVKNMPQVLQTQMTAKDKLRSIRSQKKSLEGKIEQLLVDLTNQLIARDEYNYMKHRYSKQLETLVSEEMYTNAKIKELDTAIDATHKWLETVKAYHKLPVVDRKTLESLVQSILVYDKEHVKIVLAYEDPYAPITQYLKKIEVNRHAEQPA